METFACLFMNCVIMSALACIKPTTIFFVGVEVEFRRYVDRALLVKLTVLLLVSSISTECQAAQGNESTLRLKLGQNWKFKTGDDPDWSKVNLDDSKWDHISVGRPWEENGFEDYDGYAWYRLKFRVPEEWKGHPDLARYNQLSVSLGMIDDVDESWLNGKKIGQTGSFPDPVDLQWGQARSYTFDSNLIRWGEDNVLAVRVYDSARAGGLVGGQYELTIPGWRELLELKLESKSDNGVFAPGQPISISANLKNRTDKTVTGALSWITRTDENELLRTEPPKPFEIGAREDQVASYEFAPPKPGFYQFELRLTNENETGERLAKLFLGWAPEEIDAPLTREKDFDAFWQETKSQLAAVNPKFKMIHRPDLSGGPMDTYLVEMRSLGNVLVRGWYEVPKKTTGEIPAILRVPGYTSAMHPIKRFDDMAVLSFNIRAHGNSQDDVPGKPEDYWIRGLDDKQGYFYQGAYMDCVRAVDFLATRPEVDQERIAVTGSSQGGGLAFATAALDHRIRYCVPEVPFMCDWVKYFKASHWPEIDEWIAAKPGRTWESTLRTMSYFDTMNLAERIKCPVLMGVGGQDAICPPATCFGTYNQLSSPADYRVYPYSGHSFQVGFTEVGYQQIREHFGLKPAQKEEK